MSVPKHGWVDRQTETKSERESEKLLLLTVFFIRHFGGSNKCATTGTSMCAITNFS